MKFQNTLRFILAVIAAVVSSSHAATVPVNFTSIGSIPVTSPSYTAAGNDINITLGFAPPTGTSLTIINNTDLAFISGTFTNLAQGQELSLSYNGVAYPFVANYYGGTGNDLVLHWAAQELATWGGNSKGVLGNGDDWHSTVPVSVTNTSAFSGKTVTAVAQSTSGYHSLALCSDGSLASWGNNSLGQLGNGAGGDGLSSNVPVGVIRSGALAGKLVIAMAVGKEHSLALCSDGTVAGWGGNASGQLGNNSVVSSKVPVALTQNGVLAGKTVVSISAGEDFSLALCSDGSLAAWGGGIYGQLGNGSTSGSRVPVLVNRTGVLAGKNVVAVSAGAYTSVALCSDGTIASWGSNYRGQLGNGGSADSSVPVEVDRTGVLSGKTVVAISTSGQITLALCSDNTMAAWGDNYYGQLGYTGVSRLPASSNVPLLVTQNAALAGRTVAGISVGVSHSLALYSDGSLAVWGYNGLGQLGNNTTKYEIVAVNVTQSGVLAGKTVVGVAAGTSSSLAMVARPISKVSNLAGLAFSSGTLNPAFNSASTSYTLSIPDGTTSVAVTPTTTFYAAKATVNGTEVVSGTASAPIPLSGNNPITVVVTAQDGTTRSTYSVAVKFTLDAAFVTAGGIPVEIPAYNASGNDVRFTLGFTPSTGADLTVINNTGLDFITGRFANLAHGQQVALTYNNVTYRFIANYFGGTGNDLVLQWAYQDLVAWGDNSRGALGNGSTIGSRVPVAVTQGGVLLGKTILSIAGSSHSLALCSDGTLVGWGSNHSGQLGNGNVVDGSVPVAVSKVGVLAGRTVVAIAAGAEHSLALCSDGTLAAWGGNATGQLGNNSGIGSSVPVAVHQSGILSGKTVVAISAGGNTSLALCSDGMLAAWGANSAGQLGNGSTTQSRVPTAVLQNGALAGKTPVAVAAGYDFCMVLCSDGTLATWGNNSSGQLGDNSTVSRSVPVAVHNGTALSGKTVVSIAAGFAHCLVRCMNGTMAAWGRNDDGQIGNGSNLGSSVPLPVNQSGVMAARTAVAVSAGKSHNLVRCSDGTLVVWGSNSSGQLGDNSTTNSNVPVAVPPGGNLAGKTGASVVAGFSHSLALVAKPIASISTLSGLAVSSGILSPQFSAIINSYTISVPSTTSSISVTPTVTYPDATIRVNGTLVASGAASAPVPLSIGGNTITVQVTAEDGVTQSTYTISAMRGVLNAAFTSNDSVPVEAPIYNASGYDVAFSLGFIPPTGATLTVINNTGLSFITGRFGNLAHGQAVSLTYNGVTYPFVANYYGGNGNDLVLQWSRQGLVAWGYNVTGELGNGTNTSNGVPTLVSQSGVLAGKTVMTFAAGANHNIAVCSDGTLATWGTNTHGQLGNGNTTNSNTPVAVVRTGVLTGKTVVAVAAGYRHSVVLCSDGTLATWGYNDYGQLGNNSNGTSTVPVAVVQNGVLSGKSVVAISAGSSHAIVLCSDGTLAGWGRNDTAQIGGGAGYSTSVPVAVTPAGVLAGKSVVAIRTGASHNLALCSDGTLGIWGYNDLGQIGNGSSTTNSGVFVPTTVVETGVLAGKTKIGIAAGDFHSFTLCSDGTIAAWGYNSGGQLGNGSSFYASSVPVAVVRTGVLAGKKITALSARFHNLALCSDGTFASWGDGSSGKLGRSGDSLVPAAVTPNGALAGKTVVSVAVGYSHSLVMAADPLPTTPIVLDSATSADITDTEATLGGNVLSNGNNQITERGIVYSITAKNPNPQIGDKGVTRLVAGDAASFFTVRAKSLTGLTAYSFKAYVISKLGVTYTSPVSSFTTLTADLAISMTGAPTPVSIGDTLTYTIQVSNIGSYEATVVSLNDNLDPALSFVSAAAPSDWTTSMPDTGSAGLVSFVSKAPLKIGETATFTIIAKVRTSVPTGTIIVNHATVFNQASDSNPANNTATSSTPVGTTNPTPVQPGITAIVNSQTGLFNLAVNVANTTPYPINGFRLHVDFSAYKTAYPSLRLYNATSPVGASDVYVDYPYPVPVDGVVQLKLSFYTATRTFPSPFSPVLTVETLVSSQIPGTDGGGVQPKLTPLPDHTILLEFPSVPGRWYRVRYCSDLKNWSESPVPIQASTDRMQWIDSGPPFTDTAPSEAKSRYYRVNEITAP